MIKLQDIKARLHCTSPGCNESLRVWLVLLPTGGFAPEIPPEAFQPGREWQLIVDPRKPMEPFRGYCPAHAGGRIALADHMPVRPLA